MGSMSSWILLLLAGVLAGGPGAAGAKDMTTSDICLDDGLSLQCSFDHVVHVQTVTCGDGSYACAPEVKSTLARLCEGRSSCAGLGLRDLFSVHCSSSVPRTRRLVVTFTCQPDSGPAPACRTNLCSDHSRGLRCSEGSVLHVRNVTCLGGLEPCSWATYVTLYSLCESRAECDSSGLRMLMPAYCNNSAPQVRNVFVDYLCVPKELLHTQCEGEYQTLDKPFGLLMNPAFGGRPGGTNAQCSWLLSPGEPSRKIIVTVHVAHSKWGTPNCSNTFLRVRYKDCDTQLFTTQHFCDLRQVNTPLTSCGPVEVSSWLPAASDQADRFLVSYQIVEKDTKESTPGNMSRCSTPLVTPPPTSTTRQTTRAAQTGRNYGPAATMFDYSDTIRHTGDDASRTDDNYKPVTLQFKLLVLYVFFGVVIIALVIALVYVLVSYRGISRHKRSRGDSSEKAALWRRDETPLDTFNHNSHNSLAELSVISPTTAASCPDTSCNNHVISSLPDSQVVATVHAQSGDEEEDHRLSTGSGFSSFLSGRDSAFWSSTNPYANVGHIDIDAIAGKNRASPALRADDDKGNMSRGWSKGHTGSQRSSGLVMNGDFGDIYESIDDHQPVPSPAILHNDVRCDLHDSPDVEDAAMERVPLMSGLSTPPPSPPLPPPPPALFLDDMESDADGVPHYVVNDDEYAMITRPSLRTHSPSHHSSPAAEYSNLLCLAQDSSTTSHSSDPAYVSLDTFRQDSIPVVDFRPASGPYNRDRSKDMQSPPSTAIRGRQWTDES